MGRLFRPKNPFIRICVLLQTLVLSADSRTVLGNQRPRSLSELKELHLDQCILVQSGWPSHTPIESDFVGAGRSACVVSHFLGAPEAPPESENHCFTFYSCGN